MSPCRDRPAPAHQGGLPIGGLPHRQRPLANEHGEGLRHRSSVEGLRPVHGATDDAGRVGSLCDGWPALQREQHARPIRPQVIRQGSDLAPQAIPAGAGLRALGIDPARRAGVVAAQDPRGLVEGLDLQGSTADRAGAAGSALCESRGVPWGVPPATALPLGLLDDQGVLAVTSLRPVARGMGRRRCRTMPRSGIS